MRSDNRNDPSNLTAEVINVSDDKAKEGETLNGDSLRSIDKQKYGCFRKFQSCKGGF